MWTMLLVGILAGLLAEWARRRYNRMRVFTYQGVPGPKPGFLFGTNLFVEGLHNGMARFHREYGKTFSIYFMGAPTLITSDIAILKQVLTVHFSNFTNRMENFFQSPKDPYMGMFHAQDQRWKKIRHSSTPAFSNTKIKQLTPSLNRLAIESLPLLEDAASSGKSYDVADFFEGLTLRVIGDVAFGMDLSDPKAETNRQFYEEANTVVHVEKMLTPYTFFWVFFAGFFPRLTQWFFLYFRSLNPFGLNYFLRVAGKVLQARMDNKQFKRADFIQHMMEHGKEAEQQLTFEEMQGNFVLFIFAGHDTTATALSFLAYELALAPEIQDRVVVEIAEVLPDMETDVTMEHIEKMTYLDMVVKEMLRLHPLAGIAVERMAARDIEINGIRIPAGAKVKANVKAVHYDLEQWGPEDPELFIPDRFTPERKAARDQLAFMPFGAGPRNCIGFRFALLEMKIIIVRMLQKYRFLRCAETEVPLKCNQLFLEKPLNGVFLTIEKRE